MPGEIVVQIAGLEKLQGRLQRVPEAVRPLIEAAAEYGQKRVAKYAKPHEVDKGTLAEGIGYELTASGQPLAAKIAPLGRGHGSRSSLANLAVTVNYGRQAGKKPSAAAIGRWAKAHGVAENPWKLARTIGAQGTKGVFFVERGAADLEKEIPNIIKQAIKQIERDWGR